MSVDTREQEVDSFVNREVYSCQTALVEELLRRHVFSVDEIENVYRPFDGELLNPTECLNCHNDFPFLDSETGLCESCYEDEQTPQEIFEWWLVSSWFARKLLLAGEPIIDNGYGVWWGRTTTGQAISLDIIIEKIFDDVMGT